MLFPLDGPSVQDEVSVNTSESELKVGASRLSERKVLTIQPVNGTIRVTFESGKPGFYMYQGGFYSVEASESQAVYAKSLTGTVTVVIAERA